MSTGPDRSYHSPQRDEQANATRKSILASAERLFAEQGFAGVTVQVIARAAGVSPATVYLHFPGKAAIVGALADAIVAAPDLSVEQVEGEAEALMQLRLGARIIRRLNERSWVITDILRSARGTDENLARAWDLWQQRHLHAVQRAVQALQARDSLRPGLTPLEATDILYALAGTEVYRLLVRDRGWVPERYEQWLFEVGCRELLGTSPDMPKPPSP